MERKGEVIPLALPPGSRAGPLMERGMFTRSIHTLVSTLAPCNSFSHGWAWKAVQKLLEESCSHGSDDMKSHILSFISSVGIVAPGHADSLAHPSISSPACSPTA